MFKKVLFIILFIITLCILGSVLMDFSKKPKQPNISITRTPILPSSSPTLLVPSPPTSKMLQNDYQIFQSFNNCGPASLSMALTYFGINKSQEELGLDLRPYQNPGGDNDDKSVTLDELAQEAKKFNLLAFTRPSGSIKMLKAFVAQGIPIIIETTLTNDDDIGHYRVVKGYDDAQGVIIQDDSMQGHNIQISYDDINSMWKQYNYEYLILVPKEKQKIVENILGKDHDVKYTWQETAAANLKTLTIDPNDIFSRFNLSVALYYLGEYKKSINEFEKVEKTLPKRVVWYQIEPIEAYAALGDYQRVFELTDDILNNGNMAFSELYIIRGKIYQQQGNIQAAKEEFEKALLYNKNMKAAQDALNSVLKTK